LSVYRPVGGELGHWPDTNMQKHVRAPLPVSLDVVGELGKITLTNKLVVVQKYQQNICFVLCATADIEEHLEICYLTLIIVNLRPSTKRFLQTTAHIAKSALTNSLIHARNKMLTVHRTVVQYCHLSFQGNWPTEWRHGNLDIQIIYYPHCQHIQAPLSMEEKTVSLKR